MANPLYNDFNSNDIQGFFDKVTELQKTVQNPQKIVQGLLNSGQISQQQFNQAAQMATRLRGMLPR